MDYNYFTSLPLINNIYKDYFFNNGYVDGNIENEEPLIIKPKV